ncbi:MAG: hypothetical protein IPM01_30375 [Burkholderiaceae bacterium]|nr:hypothetical protein [Burkholderiaceae bacterium]
MLKRVTLHLDISPRADRSEIERRTLASEPVAAAISRVEALAVGFEVLHDFLHIRCSA